MLRQLIIGILKKGNLSEEEITFITNPDNMLVFQRAFQNPSFDSTFNYEDLEFLGDASLKAFIPWYFFQRFPQIACSKDVSIMSQLNNKYRSKDTFSQLGERLDLWPYIKYSPTSKVNRINLLEDVFEAFVGALHKIVDDRYGFGVGFVVVSKVLKPIFDDLKIDLTYENLYDYKSRLINYLNKHSKQDLITQWDNVNKVITLSLADKPQVRTVPTKALLETLSQYNPEDEIKVSSVDGTATIEVFPRNQTIIGTARQPTRAKAEQEASRKALVYLNVTDQNVTYNFMCQ